VCTDPEARDQRECGWKPGGPFDAGKKEPVAKATGRGVTSRLDGAGLLMEAVAADEPQRVPIDLW
jgi:hypothetical protein